MAGTKRPHLTSEKRQAVLDLYSETKNQRLVASSLGISQSSVSRIVRAAGAYLRGRPVAPEGKRWCYRCKSFKARDEFWRSSESKDGLCGACKSCMSELHSTSRAAMRHWAKKTYGLSLEEYDALRAEQTHCSISGRTDNDHLDHDHQTGKPRNFLCPDCNKGLGLFHESPELLRLAADYLEAHRIE